MPTADIIRAYASDPARFVGDLLLTSARGVTRFGEVMAPHQREWIAALAPAMLAVARGSKPPTSRYWIEASKGTAKDTTLAAVVLWLLAFATRPVRAQVGAVDRDQADELHRAARDLLRVNPMLARRIEAKNYLLACASNGAEAEIIPADVAGSHGARPDLVIINELTHVERWEFVENLADNASKMPNGVLIVATNAGFTGTDAWRWRELARTSPRWSFHQFAEPAPWLDPAELAEAERRNSATRYRRLFWGVWSSGSGDALDEQDISAAIDPNLAPLPGLAPLPYRRKRWLPKLGLEQPAQPPPPRLVERPAFSYVAGLDLGIKHDHSALVVLAANHGTQRIRLALCQSWAPDAVTGKVDLEAVEAAVAEAHQRYQFATIGYDPYQAELMAQRLIRQGVPAQEVPFVGANLNRMATVLLEIFRSRRIDLYPCERLVADLRRLVIVEKPYGHKLEATRDADGHADTATAFAIALPAAADLAAQLWGPGVSVPIVPPQEPLPNSNSAHELSWSYF